MYTLRPLIRQTPLPAGAMQRLSCTLVCNMYNFHQILFYYLIRELCSEHLNLSSRHASKVHAWKSFLLNICLQNCDTDDKTRRTNTSRRTAFSCKNREPCPTLSKRPSNREVLVRILKLKLHRARWRLTTRTVRVYQCSGEMTWTLVLHCDFLGSLFLIFSPS